MTAKKDEVTGSSLSDLFEMLSHEYRRRILIAVVRDNPQDEDDITTASLANEHEGGDDALKHLKLQFRHTYLPKLAEAGFIE